MKRVAIAALTALVTLGAPGRAAAEFTQIDLRIFGMD